VNKARKFIFTIGDQTFVAKRLKENDIFNIRIPESLFSNDMKIMVKILFRNKIFRVYSETSFEIGEFELGAENIIILSFPQGNNKCNN
jgi:hypothetical protein